MTHKMQTFANSSSWRFAPFFRATFSIGAGSTGANDIIPLSRAASVLLMFKIEHVHHLSLRSSALRYVYRICVKR